MGRAVPEIVLASVSPRRRELFSRLGLEFEVVPAELAENQGPYMEADPARAAEALALAKAEAVALKRPESLVLGADTIVWVEGRALGKPADQKEARAMLEALSGRTHQVVTGLALVCASRGTRATAHETTRVTFRRLTEKEISGYVAGGEPYDKAGAYAVQGKASLFVERLEGDYENVVGLPLRTAARLLEEAGVELWPGGDRGVRR